MVVAAHAHAFRRRSSTATGPQFSWGGADQSTAGTSGATAPAAAAAAVAVAVPTPLTGASGPTTTDHSHTTRAIDFNTLVMDGAATTDAGYAVRMRGVRVSRMYVAS